MKVVQKRETDVLVKKRRDLAIQDIFLTFVAYGSFVLLVKQVIPAWAFFTFIFIYTFRSFNIRHERSHTPPTSGFRQPWLNTFSDYFQLFYLPYHEPYAGKRWKHLAHHRFHASPELDAKANCENDPHRIFEKGSPFRALGMSALYEEVNLYFDLKHRGFSHERKIMAFISIPVISLLVYCGGISNFMVLAFAYRASLTMAWFTFSYLMHLPALYESRIGDYIPTSILKISDLVLGHGLATAVFYHKSHHQKPLSYARFN